MFPQWWLHLIRDMKHRGWYRPIKVNQYFRIWRRWVRIVRPASHWGAGNPIPGRAHQGNSHRTHYWKSRSLSYVVDLPDVAKGLVVLLSDHPPLPLKVGVNCVVKVEVVEDRWPTPHTSRILHTSNVFILPFNGVFQVRKERKLIPSNSG